MKEKIVNANTESGQRLGEAIIEIIKNQLRDNDPPEVKRTLKRLMNTGESRENAMRFIATALSVELFGVLKYNELFNEKRYNKNLKELPTLPYEE